MTNFNKSGGEVLALQRFCWIDYVKSFAIFLVLFGHSPVYDGILRTVVYSFHMPLFFIVSGYLYKSRSFKSEFSKVINSLYIPYLIYIMLLYPYAVMKYGDVVSFERMFQLLSGALEDTSAVYSSLWFVFALATIRLFMAVTRKFNDVVMLVVFIIVSYVMYFNRLFLPLDVFQLNTALLCIPFFITGKLFRDYDVFEKLRAVKSALPCVLLFIAAVFLSLKNGEVGTFKNIVGYSLTVFYFNAVCLSFLIMLAAEKFLTRKNDFIETISVGTLLILGFHKFIVGKIDVFGCDNILFVIFYSAVATAFFYIPVKVFLRYCPSMLGKAGTGWKQDGRQR